MAIMAIRQASMEMYNFAKHAIAMEMLIRMLLVIVIEQLENVSSVFIILPDRIVINVCQVCVLFFVIILRQRSSQLENFDFLCKRHFRSVNNTFRIDGIIQMFTHFFIVRYFVIVNFESDKKFYFQNLVMT